MSVYSIKKKKKTNKQKNPLRMVCGNTPTCPNSMWGGKASLCSQDTVFPKEITVPEM